MIILYHNIRWSKYKARVFSAMHNLASSNNKHVDFYQIADTDGQRKSLSSVDLNFHQYPHKLLFAGSYDDVPQWILFKTLFKSVYTSDASLILIPGFHRPEYWGMLLAALLTRTKRAVFCDSTIYDQPQSFLKGLLKRLFFSLCHGFFVYGVRAKAYVVHYGAPPDKVFFRCQAAALPHDYSTDLVLAHRIAQAPPADAPRFLYVGRLSPEKSLDVLVQAFAQVHHVQPAATLVLVGAGPHRQALEDQANAAGLGQAVIFTGSKDVEALAAEYARATCLVLPSFSEPWGLVVNEALAYGCPVVVSHRCGCVPELVENKPTGFVFEAQNVDELASKLLAAPAAFADVKTTAIQCIELIAQYSPQAAAEDILAGCEKILAAH